jgi:hypothetical protein
LREEHDRRVRLGDHALRFDCPAYIDAASPDL